MKKNLLIFIFILPVLAYSQKYYWEFATSGSSCPDMTRTYFFGNDDHTNLITAPIDMATDNEGNAYVIGNYYTSNINKTYSLKQYAPTNKNIELKHEIANTASTSIYLYKINKLGEIVWANTLSSGPTFNLATYNSNTTLAVNPYSGKVYITTHFIYAMYMNNDIIDLYPKAMTHSPKRMMLCFNSDGTYDTVVLSPGVLEKPLFSSATSGVVKVSRPIGDVYGTDSISLYQLNCFDNTLGNYIYFKHSRFIGFDEEKQRYITDELAEYDINLNKVVDKNFYYQIAVTASKIINYFKAKDGSIYLAYFKENPNTNNYESKYYLIKIDKNLNLKWTFQDLSSTLRVAKDTNDNIFILTMPAFSNQYKVSSSSSYRPYPYPKINNPSSTNIYQLDTITGDIVDIVLIPTNYINQFFTENLLEIDKTNKLWMASGFVIEMEIGNHLLTADCPGNNMPYFHFVGCASKNWKQDRKNLNINDVTNNAFQVYPNPVNDKLKINNYDLIDAAQIEIYNAIGIKQQIEINRDSNEIDVSNLKTGIYFLKIKSNNHTQTYEIIKQ
ncbi:MAG: T9SS type A sorting domain-containing protein [Bacteroidota bacterium]|nr:T9SS type A sorting domain-containing protein [Bacteroidota bacterium]